MLATLRTTFVVTYPLSKVSQLPVVVAFVTVVKCFVFAVNFRIFSYDANVSKLSLLWIVELILGVGDKPLRWLHPYF